MKVMEFFHSNNEEDTYSMVGYKVENTLSDNGTVTRGICQKDKNGYLSSIKEVMKIKWNDNHDGAVYLEDDKTYSIEKETPVSMNFWGFKPSVINKLQTVFNNEIEEGIKNNPLKYEALLPNQIGTLVKENKCKIKVLTSSDHWFGVTYKEDKPMVVKKIQELKDNNTYPDELFK
jgi:hypothetical protein